MIDPAIYRDDAEDSPPVGLLGSEADGGFAEYVLVPATHAHEDLPVTVVRPGGYCTSCTHHGVLPSFPHSVPHGPDAARAVLRGG